MLVLTRKQLQSIVIGDNIEITVVEVRGQRVRLAIKAPLEIGVHRKKIAHRIAMEDVPHVSVLAARI